MTKKLSAIIYIVILMLLFVTPFLFGRYFAYIVSQCLVFAILALSLNLVFGYMGKLSFVHGGFFGLGAFCVAYLLNFISFPLALACSMVFGSLVAALVGIICINLKSIYFAMITMSAGEVMYFMVLQLISRSGLYGYHVPALGAVNILGMKINFELFKNYYFLVVVMFLVLTWVLYRITNSPFGHVMRAIKGNVERVSFVGMNEKRLQWVNFVISGAFAGIAGGLFAPLTGYLAPEMIGFVASTESIIMVIIGGPNIFVGPIIGAFFLVLVKEYLSTLTSHWLLFLGISILITLYLLPNGIAGYASSKFKIPFAYKNRVK